MDIRYLLFLTFVIILYFNYEGFTIYQKNLNTGEYPDKKQFFTVHNHSKTTIPDENKELTILGNNNYKLVNNSVKEPQEGPYSAFLDLNDFRTYEHFYHAPITDKSYTSSVSYANQLDYEIIQEEDTNKKELLSIEEENDKSIHNPFYLYGHPDNSSKILYSDKLQDLFLSVKGGTKRHETETHVGKGFHGL